jgi:5-methylcytosine-specific restriction endonuclease McrA
MVANPLDELQQRHRQLVRILIEIGKARDQIIAEEIQASRNTTIAAGFAAIIVVTDILRIGLSAADERADLMFEAIDKATEQVKDYQMVRGAGGVMTRDDAMLMVDPDLADSSRLLNCVKEVKSLFDAMKKKGLVKSSEGKDQIGVVVDIGLAMTEDFMLLYSTLRAGQSTISSTRSAYAQANARYERIRDQILRIKSQMDQIARMQTTLASKAKSDKHAGPHKSFPEPIQRAALARQKHRCASCGSKIYDIGQRGRSRHQFGEGAQGHHVIAHTAGGPITVENCVIVCYPSCHYSAHAGNWRDISIYSDIKELPMQEQIRKIAALYPHYRG